MKNVVNYLNFVFHIEVKEKSEYKLLNVVFQFIKSTKSNFGYTEFVGLERKNIDKKMKDI